MDMRSAFAAALMLAAAARVPARAEDAPAFKAHELPPAREAAWIEAVQDLKTDDGTTVLQALRYAEKLRPGKVRFGRFETGYHGASGEPEGITVASWIGAKREDDAFSILFDVAESGGKIDVPHPKTQYGGTAVRPRRR